MWNRADALRKVMDVFLRFDDFADLRKMAEADHRYYVDLGTAEEKAGLLKEALTDLVAGRDAEEPSEGGLYPDSIALRTESEIAVVLARGGKLDLAQKELAWLYDEEVKNCLGQVGRSLNPDGSISPPPTVLTPDMVTGLNGCLGVSQFGPTARALVAIAGKEYQESGQSAQQLEETYLPENYTRSCAAAFLNVEYYYIPRKDFSHALDVTSNSIRNGSYCHMLLDWSGPLRDLTRGLLAKGDFGSAFSVADGEYDRGPSGMLEIHPFSLAMVAAWHLGIGETSEALSICRSPFVASLPTCRIAPWIQEEQNAKKGMAYKVDVLTDFIGDRLNTTLFIDFQGSMRSIASRSHALQIFDGVVAALSDLEEEGRELNCVNDFLNGKSTSRSCVM